jgi:hypothetical protein
MVRVTLCLQLLLLVLILKQSGAVSDQCRKLQEERDGLERDIKNIRNLKHQNEERARRCVVSGYSVVHCLHCDAVVCH